MIVGYMRTRKNPTYVAKLTALFCNYHAIDLVYLRPQDVDIQKNRVSGKVFINNQWKSVETSLPPFIDISAYCFTRKNKNIMDYLRDNTILSYDNKNYLNKNRLQKKLEKDEYFKQFVIPTKKLSHFSDLLDCVGEYPKVVLKPIFGQRGKGVYILEVEHDGYRLGHGKSSKFFKEEELKDFFISEVQGKNYICQKYISTKTKEGYPFDCRVHVQKDGEGRWTVAKNFVRIGIGQKVMSNVHQGGGISDLVPFLKANFSDKWTDINKRINNLAYRLPYKIEEIRGIELLTLGFDIAIDEDGLLYIFEANGAPTVKPLKAEAALLRAEYYKFVLENKVDKDKLVYIQPKKDRAEKKGFLKRYFPF